MKRIALVTLVLGPALAFGFIAACASDAGDHVPNRTTNPIPPDANDDGADADAEVDANDDVTDAGADVDANLPRGAVAIATGAGPNPSVTVGYGDHTCVIAGPDRSVYCWGANDHGQAGNGEILDAGADADAALDDGGLYDGGTSPADVSQAAKLAIDEQGLPFAGANEISAGAWQSCARRANDLYCWGQRYSGAQAEPPAAQNLDRKKPRFIGNVPIARVATGGPHTCILKATGKLACFGHSSFGELGKGPAGDPACSAPIFYDYPTLAVGAHTCNGELGEMATAILGVQGLAVGELHSCAISLTHVKCWGTNASGQLGVPGQLAIQPVPQEVLADVATSKPLDAVSAIASNGGNHTCAVSGTQVYCWGANPSGELGVDPALVPLRGQAAVVAGLPVITDIGAGDGISCGITADGFVYCWGRDEVGQLGDGVPKAISFTPVQVKGPANVGVLTSAKIVAPGRRHVCAVLADQTVWCWGKNDCGQLGDGTFVDSLYPVKVKGLPQ